MRRTSVGVLGLAVVGGIAAVAQEFFSRCAEMDRWQQEREGWQGLPVENDDVAPANLDQSGGPKGTHSQLRNGVPAAATFRHRAALYL